MVLLKLFMFFFIKILSSINSSNIPFFFNKKSRLKIQLSVGHNLSHRIAARVLNESTGRVPESGGRLITVSYRQRARHGIFGIYSSRSVFSVVATSTCGKVTVN